MRTEEKDPAERGPSFKPDQPVRTEHPEPQ